MRFWVLLLLSLPLVGPLTAPLAAQTPVFDVASIRPSKSPAKSGQLCHNFKTGTENVQLPGITLNFLVIDAYETDAERFDLPDWGKSLIDVSAKIPPNTDAAGCRQMLKSLLAERFHLVTAVETRDVPTYFLKVAKSGLKLKPVDGPPADPRASASSKIENGRTRWTFRAAPMARVFIPIQTDIAIGSRNGVFETDRIIDETGLTGYYDGELEFQTTLQAKAEGLSVLDSSLKDALANQLGLTLELRKVPGKTLSIRSSDRTPTEN